ncbi:antibiotic biosynthesis monooxygenase [Fluviicola sp.]|uniref:antibiotic biosynthesis monooxygenase n=1 Tax=Fluviicola sp. TaxID=1917219 RepID=UPI0031D6BE19
MKQKILFVVTSHDQKGNTGEPTGFYLSEVSHPWEVLTKAGYEIDFVSPEGSKAPVDGFNLGDPVNKKFWENKVYRNKVENTFKPSEVNPADYVAIHYAGGHGAMWDFADNQELAGIAAKIYEQNGIVSAVCHGPAGLVNIRLSNGKYLVEGKKINAFTNEEEIAVKLDKEVPFLLESKLIERGAIFEKSGLWQEHVVSDGRVVTGQNPQSAKALGEAVLEELKNRQVAGKIIRFEVEENQTNTFRNALTEYVTKAYASNGNIMAEAYSEQDKPKTFWLIERWEDPVKQEAFTKTPSAKKLAEFSKSAVPMNVQDLEPLSKSEWRRPAEKEDNPIVIMLFVDSKAGTQEAFKSIYHTAMPQFRSEPGVITYQLSQSTDDPETFVTFEKFRSKEAFQYHLNFPPIQPVINYLNTNIKQQPFQTGLHTLIQFAPQSN